MRYEQCRVGFAGLDPGTALDPLNANFTISSKTVTVSKVSIFEDESATVTVTGTGFDTEAAIGTRPPLAGKKAGF